MPQTQRAKSADTAITVQHTSSCNSSSLSYDGESMLIIILGVCECFLCSRKCPFFFLLIKMLLLPNSFANLLGLLLPSFLVRHKNPPNKSSSSKDKSWRDFIGLHYAKMSYSFWQGMKQMCHSTTRHNLHSNWDLQDGKVSSPHHQSRQKCW